LDGLTPERTPSLTEMRAAAKASRRTYNIPPRIFPYLIGNTIFLAFLINYVGRILIQIANALLKRYA
jgi:hypothetical protein